MQKKPSDAAIVGMLLLSLLVGVLLVFAMRFAWSKLNDDIRHRQFQQDMIEMRALGGVDNYNRYLEARTKQCDK